MNINRNNLYSSFEPNHHNNGQNTQRYQQNSFNLRLKKRQDVSFTKKIRSHKKHYANNLHESSQIKQLQLTQRNQRPDFNHNKLDVKDIIGASPNIFHNEIFRNRLYGKKIDNSEQIFNSPTMSMNREETKNQLPKLYTEQIAKRRLKMHTQNNHYENSKTPLALNIDHVMDLKYPGNQKRPKQMIEERRKIKTEIENPEYFGRQQRKALSRDLRKWSPTYLTQSSNPIVYNMFPKIK